MLEVVITKLDSLSIKAQNIGSEINKQNKLLTKMKTNVDTSWKKLKKKDSELAKVLKEYRKGDNWCCYIILIVAIVCLLGLTIDVYKSKGYL